MRTTVTLDSDVERLIRDAMRERDISFKEALNDAARTGLRGNVHKRARKFAQKTFRMGEGQEFRWDKALAVADSIEDDELNRKLSLRK
ncbi:MAG: antitoxin [Acidobacteriales bacterium]|nr:MAG: antitoxin [Terriglobales bacterium]